MVPSDLYIFYENRIRMKNGKSGQNHGLPSTSGFVEQFFLCNKIFISWEYLHISLDLNG